MRGRGKVEGLLVLAAFMNGSRMVVLDQATGRTRDPEPEPIIDEKFREDRDYERERRMASRAGWDKRKARR